MNQKQANTISKAHPAPRVNPSARQRSQRAGSGSVRERNQARILKAAETVFAGKGFDGATTAEIAALAGLPKPNIHYYFGTKQQLYERVISRILEVWLEAMDVIQEDAEPRDALESYIAQKIKASQEWPDSSKIWAKEIIGGGRNVSSFLKGRLRRVVREKAKIFAKWADDGRMDNVEPAHLLFMIWASTQTYADFSAQIAAVLGTRKLDTKVFKSAEKTVTSVILKGCGIIG